MFRLWDYDVPDLKRTIVLIHRLLPLYSYGGEVGFDLAIDAALGCAA